MRAIGYIRESTKDQAENGYNLAEQERKIKAYFNYLKSDYKGATLEIISDGGYSAKSLNRPGIKKVMTLVKTGKVDTIIIHNLDRLTRNVVDLARLVELFNEKKVNLISLCEKLETDSASGKFFLYMLGLIAQWERETISERTKRAIDEAFKQKKFPRADKVLWVGYKFDKDRNIIVDEKYREMIIQIFEIVSTGELTLNEIGFKMIALGYPRNSMRDDKVKQFIENKVYIGKYEGTNYKGEKYVVNNYCEPIVDIELFEKANRMIQKRKYKKRNFYIYYSTVYCSCGELMVQESAIGKSGQCYKYYYCKKCSRRVDERKITEEIGDVLEHKSISINSSDIRERHKQKLKLLNNIKKNIKNQLLTLSDDQAKFTEQILDEIEMSIHILKNKEIPTKDIIEYYTLDEEEKRSVYLKYFDRVNVYFSSNKRYTVIVPIHNKRKNNDVVNE